jgi:flagellar basal body-associated protein FliL
MIIIKIIKIIIIIIIIIMIVMIILSLAPTIHPTRVQKTGGVSHHHDHRIRIEEEGEDEAEEEEAAIGPVHINQRMGDRMVRAADASADRMLYHEQEHQ